MHFADKDKIAKELVCALCSTPWDGASAKACPLCDVSFCASCIEDHFMKTSKCPACHEEAALASWRKPPRELRGMADRIIVMCPNKPRGCWRGPRAELSSHLKECPYDSSALRYTNDVPEELQCSVCLLPLTLPETAPCCEQTFCSRCIRAALQRSPTCPHCRASITEDVLMEPRQSLMNMLGRLEVSCPALCGWTGHRARVSDHLAMCSERDPACAGAAGPPPTTSSVPAPQPVPTSVPVLPTPAPTPSPTVPAPAAAASVGGGDAATPDGSAPRAPPPQAPGVQLTAHNYHPSIHGTDANIEFITMAHLAAPQLDASKTLGRKSLHISAVMDISGSMQGDKMKLAKEALAFVVSELHPSDKFGLVAFDDRIEEVFRPATMTTTGKDRALASVRGLNARGSTNLSGGLFAGISQARGLLALGEAKGVLFDPSRSVPKAANAIPPPPVPTGLMGRLSSLVSSKSKARVPPANSAATVEPTPPMSIAAVEEPEDAYAPAFDAGISFNTSSCKRDNQWYARYTFNLSSALPSCVEHIQVVHEKHGMIVVRGPTAFAMFNEAPGAVGKFTVKVVMKSQFMHTACFPLEINTADEEEGVRTFRVPAIGSPPTTRSRVVMLFTDGQANQGITDPSQLTQATRTILAKMPDKDVTIFTFGFGSGHNAALLQQIAEISQGTYYYVEQTDQLKRVFADCIGGLNSIVATNLSLTVRPVIGVRIAEVMTQFPVAPQPDGSHVITIKDLYAEEQRDVVVMVQVAPRVVGPIAPVVVWSLQYDNALAGGAQITATAVSAAPTAATAFTGIPNLEVDEQINRYRAARAMEAAQQLAEAGKVEEANQRIRQMQATLVLSPSCNTPYCASLVTDLKTAVTATESASQWQSQGQKQVSRMKASHALQRSNAIGDEACYATVAKKECQSRVS